jgi:hypothetical protein
MAKSKKWKRLCINVDEQEYSNLRAIAGFREESVSNLMRYLIKNLVIEENAIISALKGLQDDKPSS